MSNFAKSLKQDFQDAADKALVEPTKADHLAGIAYSLARIADNLEAAERNRANVIELLDVIERARLELECDNPGMAYQILARAHEPRYDDDDDHTYSSCGGITMTEGARWSDEHETGV